MKKRVLIISNDIPLALGLFSGLRKDETEDMEIACEPNGARAYKAIKDNEPDLLITDLETPGLAASWVSSQLDGVTIGDKVPTVAISRLLNSEEREILTDMTGVRIHPGDVSFNHLSRNILTTLTQ